MNGGPVNGVPVNGGPGSRPVPWTRYVAVGDSFTEGLWDQDPRRPDRLLGWADRLAGHLSQRRVAAGDEPLQYANLAIRGRLLPVIIAEQLSPALALKPDLVSLVGGGNDLLRPGVDVDAIAEALEDAVRRIRASGADVLLSTGVDPVDTPLIRGTRAKVALFNAHLWSLARRHGAFVLDIWGMRSLRDPRLWHADRIHLTAAGHARVAQAALVALGQQPDDPSWDEPLPAVAAVPAAARLRADLDWLRAHAYPWATRRVRGRSSGQGITAKQPTFRPLTSPDAGRDVESLDVPTTAREDGTVADAVPPPAGPARDADAALHDGVRGHAATRGSHGERPDRLHDQ